MTSWSEETEDGEVYEEYKEGYFTDNKYEGEIENGKPHGNGTWIQSDGGTYVGQFVMDVEKGLGHSLGLRIHLCQGNRMKESGKIINKMVKGKYLTKEKRERNLKERVGRENSEMGKFGM